MRVLEIPDDWPDEDRIPVSQHTAVELLALLHKLSEREMIDVDTLHPYQIVTWKAVLGYGLRDCHAELTDDQKNILQNAGIDIQNPETY
jgi:uncharacterized protein HemY